MQVKLLLFIFYVNGGLHAVCIGKQFETTSNFWMVRFSETKSELNFSFLHIPSSQGIVKWSGECQGQCKNNQGKAGEFVWSEKIFCNELFSVLVTLCIGIVD